MLHIELRDLWYKSIYVVSLFFWKILLLLSLYFPNVCHFTERSKPPLNGFVTGPIFDIHTAAILEFMYLLNWSASYGVSFLPYFIKVAEFM
jgi:hypothetical protein